MKVLHLVKTSHGAQWALEQAKVLMAQGVEVHVALPDLDGHFGSLWKDSGAHIHIVDTNLPVLHCYKVFNRLKLLRNLVKRIQPDLVHSHFFSSTVMMRLALINHSIKRVFQVPGPLHLENVFFRTFELLTSNSNDNWIASSQYIQNLYLNAGIDSSRVAVSYYGSDYTKFQPHKDDSVRSSFEFTPEHIVIGNLNYMYPPKWYLGQSLGLKRHEVLIQALNIASEKNSKIKGMIIGGQWGTGNSYEASLWKLANDNIVFTGKIPPGESQKYLANLDILVHIPLSENCGGIVEPMHMEIPVLAADVGGLSELVHTGVSGKLVKDITPQHVADQIIEMVENYDDYKQMAIESREKIEKMFNVQRTGKEVFEIYTKILN